MKRSYDNNRGPGARKPDSRGKGSEGGYSRGRSTGSGSGGGGYGERGGGGYTRPQGRSYEGGNRYEGGGREQTTSSDSHSSARPAGLPTRAPLSPANLERGMPAANKALEQLVQEFAAEAETYLITQVVATVSFDSDGSFLGFGPGGAASFEVTLTPPPDEDLEEVEPD